MKSEPIYESLLDRILQGIPKEMRKGEKKE